MQYVNRASEFGNIHHALDAALVANSDLANARANRFHGLPVIGIFSHLHLKKLLAGFVASIFRKAAEVGPRAAAKLDLA